MTIRKGAITGLALIWLIPITWLCFISSACKIERAQLPTPHSIEGKWGYLDSEGNLVISPKFDEACPFSEGLARVAVNRKSGYINPSGQLVVPLRYDEALGFL